MTNPDPYPVIATVTILVTVLGLFGVVYEMWNDEPTFEGGDGRGGE